eukprot:scpid36683/ scgid4451/ Probable RNA-directed DNA polymerase from transposon X-element; Reverse transcriptase
MEMFRNDLVAANLCSLDGSCDEMWTRWLQKFLDILDKHAPLRTRRTKTRKHVPWMDANLLATISSRNRAHRKWLRTCNPVDHEAFRQTRRDVNQLNRRLKACYYQDQFANAEGQPRQTWRVINQVSGRTRTHTAPQCPPDEIGQVFADIVTDATRPKVLSIPSGPHASTDLCCFKPVSIACVRKLLSSVDTTKSTGSDGVPALVLAACSDLLAPSVTLIFNKSLSEGRFPLSMKLANITPVYKNKSGDPTKATNFRPVSLLPIISKILERIVHSQLTEFLTTHSLYPDCQFGFRKQHSTEDAVVMASEAFANAKDSGLSTCAAFVDMSKAFDKVQHGTLIRDLFSIGVGGSALNWLADYLSDRQQRVVIGNQHSKVFQPSSGVPQGSVLGPLLFVLYVRGVAAEVQPYGVRTVQFADDIMLYISSRDKHQLERNMSSAVTHLARWLASRNLVLNESKTQILFIPAHRSVNPRVSVMCSGVQLAQVESAKYLGVHMDQDLKWTTMVNQIAKRAACKIAVLFRNRRCMPLPCRITYLKSLILPDFLYASNCFSAGLTSHQLERLERLLKRAVRCVYNAPFASPSAPLYCQLRLHSLEVMYCHKLLGYTWRCLQGKCSTLLTDMFSPLNAGRATRSQGNRALKFPVTKTSAGTHSASFQCVSLWNRLQPDIRKISQYRRFM